MNRSRRSIPFHVTLLTLMVLIVLPLAAALLWLGWRAVDQLEERSVRHRMASLDSAVEGFLRSGLRVVVAVGSTLAEQPAFPPGSTVPAPQLRGRPARPRPAKACAARRGGSSCPTEATHRPRRAWWISTRACAPGT